MCVRANRRPWGVRAVRWAALLFHLCLSRAALARGDSVEVEGPLDSRIVVQLAQELRAAGFVAKTKAAEPTHLPPSADADDAPAFVLRVGSATIEVWSIDPFSSVATMVDVVSFANANESDAAVAARRAEELVRARLLPIDRPPASAVASANLPIPVAPSISESAHPLAGPGLSSESSADSKPRSIAQFGLDAGAMLLISPGGVSPAADILLMPRWMPTNNVIARGVVAVPLTSPELTSTEGQATVKEWLLGATVDWSPLSADSVWAASLGAGLGAVRVQSQGTANPPYVSSNGDAWAWLPFAHAGTSRRLGSSAMRLGVDVWVGVSLPEIAILFPSRQIATWGRPLAGVSLALQIDAL
jgi:hypothetical protein